MRLRLLGALQHQATKTAGGISRMPLVQRQRLSFFVSEF
jgi:hypothetical protein